MIDFLLRRDHRTVAPPPKVLADLRKRRSRELAGQPHGQHPRLDQGFRFPVGLQAAHIDPEDVADRRDIELEIVLLHEGGQATIPGVSFRRRPLVFDPVGM